MAPAAELELPFALLDETRWLQPGDTIRLEYTYERGFLLPVKVHVRVEIVEVDRRP